MRQSIGNIWITGLVITFMLIFTGYLAVTISYSAAVKNKNYILSIIEKRNGITSKAGVGSTSKLTNRSDATVYVNFGTLETINLFLRGSSYKQQGTCGEGVGDAKDVQWYGVKDIYKDKNAISISKNNASVYVDKVKIDNRNKNDKYYYCFAKININNRQNGSINPPAAYYRVRLFYALELPIVSSMVFTIDGKTDIIETPSRCEIDELRPSGINC